jgi:hypothetical protein
VAASGTGEAPYLAVLAHVLGQCFCERRGSIFDFFEFKFSSFESFHFQKSSFGVGELRTLTVTAQTNHLAVLGL